MKKFIFGSLFIVMSLCVFAPSANAQYYSVGSSFNLGLNFSYSNTTSSSYYPSSYNNYGGYNGYNNYNNYNTGNYNNYYSYTPVAYINPYGYGTPSPFLYTPTPWGQGTMPWGANYRTW